MKRTVTTTRPLRSDAVAIAVHSLREPATIRLRCANIADAVAHESSRWWRLEPGKLDAAVELVLQTTRKRYPGLKVPYHSRWRNFEAGGINRPGELSRALAHLDPAEQARSRIDLAVVSVLLDAGAGNDWNYVEPGRGITPSAHDMADPARQYAQNEGLAVATFRGFMRGLFSSDLSRPCRVDADALLRIDADVLAAMFEAHDANPLVGLEGRARLLRGLGLALKTQTEWFGAQENHGPARPGGLYDVLSGSGASRSIAAADILRALLAALGGIWLTESRIGDTSLGDTWRHPHAGGMGAASGWVPFHMLSQWLAYSLLEPFELAGIKVSGRDALTALPDMNNGGLLIDTGVITFKDRELATRTWQTSDEIVVEWRALTVHLIDKLAERIRIRLGKDSASLPLACIVEGGTWAAGNELARRLRQGRSALVIASDATVF
jgi:hypothetical protein